MARSFDDINNERNTRIDKPSAKRTYFFDLNKQGIFAPKSKNPDGLSDLAVLTNEQAVMEAVYNILLTEPGERVMNPTFGCNLNQYLFEPIDRITAMNIMTEVYDAVSNFEERVYDLEVVVTPKIIENAMIIDLYMKINTVEETIKLTTALEKVR